MKIGPLSPDDNPLFSKPESIPTIYWERLLEDTYFLKFLGFDCTVDKTDKTIAINDFPMRLNFQAYLVILSYLAAVEVESKTNLLSDNVGVTEHSSQTCSLRSSGFTHSRSASELLLSRSNVKKQKTELPRLTRFDSAVGLAPSGYAALLHPTSGWCSEHPAMPINGKFIFKKGWALAKELKGGLHFFDQSHPLTVRAVVDAYKDKPENLREAFEKLNATPIDFGDIGYEVEVLPGIRLRYIYWDGDEEFSPELTVNFQKGVEDVLALDVVWAMVNVVNTVLVNVGRNNISGG